jgi:hypothetical protein
MATVMADGTPLVKVTVRATFAFARPGTTVAPEVAFG